VDKIFKDSLERVLNLGMVPILPCIGWSPSGKPYNVPSAEIALAVSSALKAEKLFFLSVHDRLQVKTFNTTEDLETRPDGSLVRLTPQQAEKLITSGSISSSFPIPFLRELQLALSASRAGVHRVHLLDAREEGAVLKELFSNLGVGTMVYNDEYDSIRAFHSRDLPDILRMMEPLMQKGVLIRRNPEQIQEKKADYAVLEIDGSVRACGALHDWGDDQGEIAAVATDPDYKDMGLGRKIVGYLVEKARKSKMKRVFVLTTQSQDWFEALGFKETQVETLPGQKRKTYDQSRKSKVFALVL